jgi:ubiquinone biosynthesis protein
LSPEFDIIASCEKFSRQIVKDLYSPENLRDQAIIIARDAAGLLRHAPVQLRRLLKAALDGDIRIQVDSESVEYLGGVVERSSSRIALSLMAAALFIAGAVLARIESSGQVFGIPIIALIPLLGGMFTGAVVILSIIRRRSLL